jgi:23S rRNA (cytidine1920-2'-O)/16S rRNA (cytidine1409-2'-O)-methyltransferase
MAKQRLDAALVTRRLVPSRSQAENWIKLGQVTVNGKVVTKPGYFVDSNANVNLEAVEQYVSRAGLKLASVAEVLELDFRSKTVLDVGSSTGGFTDYALQHGAEKVYAVDVGTDQLHPKLRADSRVELHEKTDIRDFYLDGRPDIIVIDVSFISLRQILPHIAENLSDKKTQIVAMIKPQFEAGKEQVNKGIIKNDSVRRQILKDFEDWAHQYFVIVNKRDSEVAGAKGNRERFYLLTIIIDQGPTLAKRKLSKIK